MRLHVIPQRGRRQSIRGQAVPLLVLAGRRLCPRPEPTVDGADVVASPLELGLSQYGLINAVTRTAEDAKSYDRASELEMAGATVLDLKPTEWRDLALAA